MNCERAGWTVGVVLGLAIAASATSCNSGVDCSDGLDNDADGLLDHEDPGCALNGNLEAPDPAEIACSDGVDNDDDGAIDIDDPGCASSTDLDEFNEPVAACNDGIDNDDDGLLDYPNEPGCDVSLDDDEADECPNGDECPACGNGLDDDGDDAVDYPDDLGCDSASDRDEYNADPSVCGANVPLLPLPGDGIASGTLSAEATNELISLECGGSGAEVVYELTVDSPIALIATTNFPETDLDTVLYLRGECRESSSEIVCNDDLGENRASRIAADRLEAGTWYLVVDARSSGLAGPFKLAVTRFHAEGEPCDPDDTVTTCQPGLRCRKATMDAPGPTCEPPQCSDGDDFDGDGANDFPDDPGCTDGDDNSEGDSCPNGTSCPQCGDGDDNGDPEDTLADYPDDLGCSSASDDSERDCTDSDLLVTIDDPTITGTTAGMTDDFTPSCNGANSARDRVYRLIAPGDLTELRVDTEGSALNTVLTVRAGDCSSSELDCDNDGGIGPGDSRIVLDGLDAGLYYIVVDGLGATQGSFNLHVSGIIADGQPCDPAQVDSGLFSCAGGGACTAGTCQD